MMTPKLLQLRTTGHYFVLLLIASVAQGDVRDLPAICALMPATSFVPT